MPGVMSAPDDQTKHKQGTLYNYIKMVTNEENVAALLYRDQHTHTHRHRQTHTVRQTHLREVSRVNLSILVQQRHRVARGLVEDHGVCGARLLNPPETMTPGLM